jgi:membrane-associated phospholipid phosphatase
MDGTRETETNAPRGRLDLTIRSLAALDTGAVRWVRQLPHPASVTESLMLLSRATDHSDGWIVVGLTCAVTDRRRRQQWLAATARIALVELTARAIKRAVPRERPQLTGLPPLAPTPTARSFPSSHTAAAVAAINAFEDLLPSTGLRAVATVSAFSRLYLGVHFPSDVVAGAILGRLLG